MKLLVVDDHPVFRDGLARRTSASFTESVMLRFENLDLVENLQREKVAAEQANAAKSRFLAAASHDLRQPVRRG